MEIVIRSNDFYTICMCCLNNCFHRIISCKRFYVYKINQSCFCRILIQFYISFCLNGFLSAFFGCTECEQDRSLTKYLTKSFHCLFCLCEIENIFIPVYTPLNNIGLCRFDSFCCCKDFFSRYPNDRYTDFRDSCTNFNISYFYSIHNSIPFYDFFGGETLTGRSAPVQVSFLQFSYLCFLCIFQKYTISYIYKKSQCHAYCCKNNVHYHNLGWLHLCCCCKDRVVTK